MTDNWMSEIELQKIYALSPKEAFCQICIRNGLKMSEIAYLAGISPETVHTFLQRGQTKMKRDSKKVDLILIKSDYKVEGIRMKLDAAKVLLKFVSRVLEIPFVDGKNLMGLHDLDPAKPGDAQWMNQNVFRLADLVDVHTDQAIDMRVDKLVERYKSVNEGQEKVGTAIIQYYFDQMYLKYEFWE